jgi:hypothetical protein
MFYDEQTDRENGKYYKKNFSRRDIENFKYLWEKESSAEIYLNNGLNDSYKSLLSKFVYYFESYFPLKTYYKKEVKNSRYIVKRIKVSCQSRRFVNNLNRN